MKEPSPYNKEKDLIDICKEFTEIENSFTESPIDHSIQNLIVNSNRPNKMTLTKEYNDLINKINSKRNIFQPLKNTPPSNSTINKNQITKDSYSTINKNNIDNINLILSNMEINDESISNINTNINNNNNNLINSAQKIDEDIENIINNLTSWMKQFQSDTINSLNLIKQKYLMEKNSIVDNEKKKYNEMISSKNSIIDNLKNDVINTQKTLNEQMLIKDNCINILCNNKLNQYKQKLKFSAFKMLIDYHKIKKNKKIEEKNIMNILNTKKRIKIFNSFINNCKEQKMSKLLTEKNNECEKKLSDIIRYYNKELSSLQNKLKDANDTIVKVNNAKNDIQENFKKVLLKGVMAMNKEAMDVFHRNSNITKSNSCCNVLNNNQNLYTNDDYNMDIDVEGIGRNNYNELVLENKGCSIDNNVINADLINTPRIEKLNSPIEINNFHINNMNNNINSNCEINKYHNQLQKSLLNKKMNEPNSVRQNNKINDENMYKTSTINLDENCIQLDGDMNNKGFFDNNYNTLNDMDINNNSKITNPIVKGKPIMNMKKGNNNSNPYLKRNNSVCLSSNRLINKK